MLFQMSYLFADREIKEIIDKDVDRRLKYSKVVIEKRIRRLSCCLKNRDFLPVFRFRISRACFISKILCKVASCFHRIPLTVEIGGKIAGGLMISHMNSVVYVRQAGKNFRIGPGVVIGQNKGRPIVGDNVYVAANATVIGDIHIGNNVIVGAGSVVVKDVPDNCVVAGNPARIIREIREDDLEGLV